MHNALSCLSMLLAARGRRKLRLGVALIATSSPHDGNVTGHYGTNASIKTIVSYFVLEHVLKQVGHNHIAALLFMRCLRTLFSVSIQTCLGVQLDALMVTRSGSPVDLW